MSYQLLKLSLSALCFGICAAVNLMEIEQLPRAISFVGGFMSGWCCCYSIGCMVDEIKPVKSRYPEE